MKRVGRDSPDRVLDVSALPALRFLRPAEGVALRFSGEPPWTVSCTVAGAAEGETLWWTQDGVPAGSAPAPRSFGKFGKTRFCRLRRGVDCVDGRPGKGGGFPRRAAGRRYSSGIATFTRKNRLAAFVGPQPSPRRSCPSTT